jgi:hypothetical protein
MALNAVGCVGSQAVAGEIAAIRRLSLQGRASWRTSTG